MLTEYFVKQADYQEEECINMVFLLHKKTMDENYSLEKLTAECMQCDGKTEEIYEEPDEEPQDAYELAKRDWITEREMNGNMMRETENLWLPVKRFLDRHKKPKWGDWDGLHIEEEEL